MINLHVRLAATVFSGGRANKSQLTSPHNHQSPHSPTKHRPSSAVATNRQNSRDNKSYTNKTEHQNQNRPQTGRSNNNRNEGGGQKSNRGGRGPGGQGRVGDRGGRRHSRKSEGDSETQQSQNSEASSPAKNQTVQSNPGTI